MVSYWGITNFLAFDYGNLYTDDEPEETTTRKVEHQDVSPIEAQHTCTDEDEKVHEKQLAILTPDPVQSIPSPMPADSQPQDNPWKSARKKTWLVVSM